MQSADPYLVVLHGLFVLCKSGIMTISTKIDKDDDKCNCNDSLMIIFQLYQSKDEQNYTAAMHTNATNKLGTVVDNCSIFTISGG